MSYPVPPRNFADGDRHRQMLADCVAGIMQGRTNNTGLITLRPSQSTTVLADFRLTPNSVILLVPTTANAAVAQQTMYINGQENETATLNHASNSQTDKIFRYCVVG